MPTKKRGLLGNLGDLLDGLVDLADHLEDARQDGESEGSFSVGGREARFGVHVRTGIGGDREAGGKRPRPVNRGAAKPRADARAHDSAVVSPTLQVQAEVHPVEGGVLVIADLPGVGADDLEIDVCGDVLSILAQVGVEPATGAPARRYEGEVLLPVACAADDVDVAANNGILTIRLQAASSPS